MKKVINLLLLVAIFVTCMVPMAYARDTEVISVGSVSGEVGQQVTVNVSLSGNAAGGFKGGSIQLSWNKANLELVAMNNVAFTGVANPATGVANHAATTFTEGDCVLTTATFKILTKGTHSVSLAKAQLADASGKFNVATAAGTITGTVAPCANHTWGDWNVTANATCEADGSKTRTCSVCDFVDTETIASIGHAYGNWTMVDEDNHKRTCANDPTHVETDEHDWDNGEITTQPTCKNSGVKTYTCDDCNGTKTEEVPATGEHVYTNWTKVSDDKHEGTCGCGEKKQENHKWDAGKITTEPTCSKTGVKTYTCSVCSGTKTETVAATGDHNYTNWTKVNDDKHEGTCGCGEKIQKDHKWDAGKITTEPTCKNPGVKTFTCADCKGTKTEPVAATGKHVYTASYKDNGDGNTHTGVCACGTENPTKEQHKLSLKETINPDCKNDGKKIYQCTLCDAKVEETLPSTGNHNYETWKSDGEKTHTSTCTGCNSEKKTEDHIWNKGEITKQPTCKEEGVKTFTCTAKGCGETKTEAIAKTTNHTYGDWTPVEGTDNHEHVCTVCNTAKETKAHEWKLKEKVAATCVAEGKEDYTCICGAEKTVVLPVDKDAHKLGYTKNEETENHTVFCENEGCTLAPFFEEHNHNIFGDRVGNKQEKLCACGDKITEVVKSNSADLDDVPKTGDITGQIVAFVVCGLAAMMAVAFTFKRKAVK